MWALPVALLPDELLSSWLVRAALAQGCDPLVLTGELWPRWRVWTLDTDRAMPFERLLPLSRVAGIAAAAFAGATLRPIAARIQGREPDRQGVWPWVLALGARNTWRRGGLQYCPYCLREDAAPYFRIHWRLAWHTGCVRHGCTLADRCHNCGAALAPHRLVAEDRHPAVCWSCKRELGEGKTTPCSPGPFKFQEAADAAILNEQCTFLGRPLPVAQWFAAADFLAGLVRRASRSGTKSLLALLERGGGVAPGNLPPIYGMGIELLRPGERQGIMDAVWCIAQGDRERFSDALKATGITRQGFCGDAARVPAPLADLAESLPDRPGHRSPRRPIRIAGPRPRHEVVRMMARLERRLGIDRI